MAVWDDAVAAQAWEGPPAWAHGNLHPANVVVSDGTLSGIVDFGDMFAAGFSVGPRRRIGAATCGHDVAVLRDVRACERGGDPAGRGLAAMKSR
ncbi:phosphotransferase [[Mycobacterium] burgundiense]|uniref:Phosphotransferase n=1 Tax=[Mycobacterium] burgundiense TaxID=3064286 RepID=A0ABM9LRU5_9MYCO|nr:phosphotransferase [Mycolicibacterium sp. MU0053]